MAIWSREARGADAVVFDNSPMIFARVGTVFGKKVKRVVDVKYYFLSRGTSTKLLKNSTRDSTLLHFSRFR